MENDIFGASVRGIMDTNVDKAFALVVLDSGDTKLAKQDRSIRRDASSYFNKILCVWRV